MTWQHASVLLLRVATSRTSGLAQDPVQPSGHEQARRDESHGETATAVPDWHYGGFVDLGYALDFNFPENHLFRNRSTNPRVNELDLNMAGIYVRKDATERWGMELIGRR